MTAYTLFCKECGAPWTLQHRCQESGQRVLDPKVSQRSLDRSSQGQERKDIFDRMYELEHPEKVPPEKPNTGNNFCRTCGCHFPPDDEDRACRAWEECQEAQAPQSARGAREKELQDFIDKAFEVYPNLDLDIANLDGGNHMEEQ